MKSVDDYFINQRPRPAGPPLPFDEYRRRFNIIDPPVREFILVSLATGDSMPVKSHNLGVERERSIMRCWRRYVGMLCGDPLCSCGDVAAACGGPTPEGCRRGGRKPT